MAGTHDVVHFLLVYSFTERRLIDQDEFHDANEATAAYAKAEAKYRGNDKVEIVLVGAESIETIMATHGHYFRRDDISLFSEFLPTEVPAAPR